jgi:glycosyltransferase involved in cell wall biosynthesis
MISVILGVYNHLPYLAEAIESVLAQTYGDFEFIIIDDASTEPVWDLVQGYARCDRRIRALRNSRNLGLAESLNIGLDLSKGDFIARQDADDRSHPERFANQLSAFAVNVGLVTTWALPIDRAGEVIEGKGYERRCHLFSADAARILRGHQQNAVIEIIMFYAFSSFLN